MEMIGDYTLTPPLTHELHPSSFFITDIFVVIVVIVVFDRYQMEAAGRMVQCRIFEPIGLSHLVSQSEQSKGMFVRSINL